MYDRLDPLDFHTPKSAISKTVKPTTDYSSLFEITPATATVDDDEFDETVVTELIERLDGSVMIPLTHEEKSNLAALAQATLEVEQSRRSLDICGLRYLISIRTFVNRDRRGATSGSATPAVNDILGVELPRAAGHSTPPLADGQLSPARAIARISFRNIVWATHSESHEVLLQAATASCNDNKMTWEDAKRLGVFLWLKNQETIKSQLEVIARNRFMSSEDRDPIGCSLFFFALGKKQVVHGLWRQAPGHKEQNMMIKFLANDFTTERWKTAAMKNAYALLSKQRYGKGKGPMRADEQNTLRPSSCWLEAPRTRSPSACGSSTTGSLRLLLHAPSKAMGRYSVGCCQTRYSPSRSRVDTAGWRAGHSGCSTAEISRCGSLL